LIAGEGEVIDYFDGYDDIKKRRIRFVGEPAQRIQEDYLRILRYFRFYGRVSVDEVSHDTESLLAINEHSHGLNGVAGERIWVELKKIITGRFADSLMKHIIETNVHVYIGFPQSCDLEEFSRVWKNNQNEVSDRVPQAMTMICSLFKSPSEVDIFLRLF